MKCKTLYIEVVTTFAIDFFIPEDPPGFEKEVIKALGSCSPEQLRTILKALGVDNIRTVKKEYGAIHIENQCSVLRGEYSVVNKASFRYYVENNHHDVQFFEIKPIDIEIHHN